MNKQKLELITYECQIGMYYSEIFKLKNGFIVYSNLVDEPEWNFFAGFKAKTVAEFESAYSEAKKYFAKFNRTPNFAISPLCKISKQVIEHINKNYKNYLNHSTLLTKTIKPIKTLPSNYSYRVIDNKTEKELFVNTYTTSKNQHLPGEVYTTFPKCFIDALSSSFDNYSKWKYYNYVSLYKNKPIGMISACVKNKFCGFYGGGTYVKHRGKGVFTNMLKHIETDLKKKGVKYLFGIVVSDTYNEKLYNAINWKSVFKTSYYV